VAKELNLQDFDINLCAEAKDVHCKKLFLSFIVQSYKCFDNYLKYAERERRPGFS